MKNLLLRFSKQIIQMITRMLVVLAVLGSFGISTASGYPGTSGITGTTPASRCGAGILVLHATAASGTITWYDVPFYGTALGTGVTFTTPWLEVTKTYYVDAETDGCSLNVVGGVNTGRVPVIATISANSIQAAIFYSSNTFCNSVNTTQTPTRTGTAGGTYTATNGLTINAGTGAFIPSANVNGNYTITYTVTAAEGCVENPAFTNISITTAPTAPAISYTGSPFCTTSGTVTVSQTGASGGTYSASPSGLSINPTSGTITPASSLTGNYTVAYFVPGAGGCLPQTATTTVVILQLPTAAISYTFASYTKNQGNQPVALTGTGGYTGGTFSSTSGLTIDPSTGAITPSSSDAGTYTVSYTLAAVSPCAAPAVATTSVTIYPLPTASIAGSQTVCQNSTAPDITFTGAGGTAPYTFTYQLNGGSDLSITTTSGSSATISQPTQIIDTYIYTLTNVSDAHGSYQAVSEQSATIAVTSLPVATFAYAANPYCSNGTDATPTMLEGGVEGTFSSTTGLVFVSTATGEVDLSESTAGTYTVTNTIAAAGGCGVVTATASITINKLPVATFAYSGTPYCNSAGNPSPTYTGDGEAGLFSASPAGIVFVSVTTGEIDLTNSLPGAYTITNTIAAADGCSEVSSTASITVTATPVAVEITYPGVSFCKTADPIAVTQTGTTGGVYTASGVANALTINASTGEITPSTSTSGTYTITYTIAAAGGCVEFSDTYELTITDAPTATIAYSASAYCLDNSNTQTVTLTGTTGGTFSSEPAGLSMNASGTITPNTSTAGDYTVTYTIAAAGGCAEVTTTTMVAITTPPTITAFSYGTPFCMDISTPQMPTLTGTAFYNPANAWFSSTSGLALQAASGAINPSTSTAGTYTVTYTIPASGGCAEVTAQATVVINALPAAPSAGDVTVTYNGASHTGTATAPEGSTVVWYDASTAGSVTSAPVGTNVGTYTAYAESVVDATGCKSATRTLVTVQINAASLAISANDVNKTYGTLITGEAGSSAFTPVGLQNGETIGSVTIAYGTGSAATAAVNTYTDQVTASAATGGTFTAGNYTITYPTGDIIVGAKGLAITANNVNKTYGAAITGAAGSTEFTSVGLANGETIGSVTIAYGTGSAATAAVNTYTDQVTASAATGGTFAAGNYTITYPTGDIIVGAKGLAITANNVNKTYGTAITGASGSTGFTQVGLENGETIGSVTTAYGTGSAAIAGVATYTDQVTASAATGGTFTAGNYSITYPTGDIIVGAKALAITANDVNKEYGTLITGAAGSTAFTSVGLANSETIGSVTITYGTGSAATSAVNTYTDQVTASAATGGTFTAGNYTITYPTGDIIVGAKGLAITANNVNKTYGAAITGAAGSTEFTSVGLANGETIGSVTIAYGTGSAATAAVNTYTDQVTASAATGGTFTAGNYTITYPTGDIIVGAKVLAITANDVNKTYGTAITGASGSTGFTQVGLENGETIGSVTIAYGTGSAAIAGVATYTDQVTASAATGGTFTAGNYSITYPTGDIIVDKKELTVTAENKSKTDDGLVFSAFTYVITGFVNAETEAALRTATALSGEVTYTGIATTAITPGVYNTITPVVGGLSSTNYSFTPANGTLTIHPVAPTAINATQTFCSGN